MRSIIHGELSNMLPPIFSQKASGQVAGKFKNSFYIELPGKGRGGRDILIHTGPSSRSLCAFGLSVDDGELKEILDGIQPGDLAYVRPGCLTIYGQEEQFCEERVEGGFFVKDLCISVLLGAEAAGSAGGILGLLEKRYERGRLQEKMGIPWDEGFFHYAGILRDGEDTESLCKAADFFCGRGLGLTPSGDDLLLGYICVLKAAGQPEGEVLASYLAELAAGKTTEVSLAYCQAAEAGFVNEDFKEFLFCAFDRGRIEAGEAVRQLESLGHTSGHDTLFGTFLALKRLERVERIKK